MIWGKNNEQIKARNYRHCAFEVVDEWSGVFYDVSDDVELYCNGRPGVSSRCPLTLPPSLPHTRPPSHPACPVVEGQGSRGSRGSTAAAPCPMCLTTSSPSSHTRCAPLPQAIWKVLLYFGESGSFLSAKNIWKYVIFISHEGINDELVDVMETKNIVNRSDNRSLHICMYQYSKRSVVRRRDNKGGS